MAWFKKKVLNSGLVGYRALIFLRPELRTFLTYFARFGMIRVKSIPDKIAKTGAPTISKFTTPNCNPPKNVAQDAMTRHRMAPTIFFFTF